MEDNSKRIEKLIFCAEYIKFLVLKTEEGTILVTGEEARGHAGVLYDNMGREWCYKNNHSSCIHGGGYIRFSREEKKITVHGKSVDYGGFKTKEVQPLVMEARKKERLDDFAIVFSNPDDFRNWGPPNVMEGGGFAGG